MLPTEITLISDQHNGVVRGHDGTAATTNAFVSSAVRIWRSLPETRLEAVRRGQRDAAVATERCFHVARG
jgi:hypothetical protein